MAIYENMPPDGHLNFAERIFIKIKNLFDTKVQTDVPANAIFTDEKVTQTESTTNENYEVLVSGTASTVTTTEGVNKSEGLLYNPNKKALMIGTNTYVSTVGQNSFAQGFNVAAIGQFTHAEGLFTSAYGTATHTEGYGTTTNGAFGHSEGYNTYAGGTATHVEGYSSTGGGQYSHVEGVNNYGDGQGNHVEGYRTYATEMYNHVEGENNTVKGYANHLEGYYNQINGSTASHIEGYHNYINASTASHAEGYNNSVVNHHAHAEGRNTYISGYGSHTEGNFTTAAGDSSHAEGENTLSYGNKSHAEGLYTVAQGNNSHAEGQQTTAVGQSSHSEGLGNVCTGSYSHVEGLYNKALGEGSHAEGEETTAGGRFSHSEGYENYAQGNFSHAEGEYTLTKGDYSHAEGQDTTARGPYSHAEGYVTIADGTGSHAEGWDTYTEGSYAHAEGYQTTATSTITHSEGECTLAYGRSSHAEGQYTYAQGESSHAEGYRTYAQGKNSHTAGNNTTALFSDSYVFGAYNLPDGYDSTVHSERGNYIEIVGNGLSSTQLSNARTLDWDGNEWVAAGVSVDGLSSTTEGETSTTVQTSFAHLQNKSLTLSDTTDTITPGETEGEDPTIETEKHVIEVTPEDIILDDTWDGSRKSLKETVTFLGSQSAANKVDRSGDTMTGPLVFKGVNDAIQYTGSQATYPMIKFIDNAGDMYGNGISIGGGGTTIIGGGESSDAMVSSLSGGGNELMYIGNDGNVNIFTNLQNGWDSRKTFTFDTNGALTATKFIGSLQGTADSATKWGGCTYDISTANATDTWIPVINSNKMQHTFRAIWTAKTHSNWNNNQSYLATLSCLTYWDGAYNSSHNSNLTYCNKGAFGTIVTKNTGDYAAASHSHTYASMEFVGNSPHYIDFHWAGTTADYSARIIESSKGALLVYNSITNSSDRNLKKDIVNLDDNFLNLLNKVKPRQFRWKKGDEFLNLGFIAQEVDEALDEIGVTDKPLVLPGNDDGEIHTDWGLSYNQMIPILWRVCQIQQEKIENLEAAVKAL